MSKQLETVIQRAISDAAFRRQLQSNPEAALRGFKLTQDEVAALRSGDATKLMSLGIDQRMSKVFAVPGEQLNRGSIGDLLDDSSSTASGPAAVLRDPDNPANARGYIGDQATSAPTSDAIEDQSHAFAASRDQGGSTSSASILRDPENPANARGFIGDPSESASRASILRDPDNPANARGYIGGEGGSTSEASAFGDPENLANRSGFVGDQSPNSAATNDAFLSQGEAGQYSTDPNWSSDLAEDTSHAFNPAESAATPEVDPSASTHHDGDIPT